MFSAADKRKTTILSQRKNNLQHTDIQKMQWFQNKCRIVKENKAKDILSQQDYRITLTCY